MENIFKLLSLALQHNIISQNAYRTRLIGFKSEAYFSEFLSLRGTKTLKGGFFIPVNENDPPYNNFIYYTVLKKDDVLEDYLPVYLKLSNLNYRKLLVIKFVSSGFETWKNVTYNNIVFPTPDFKIYSYDKVGFSLTSWDVNQFVNLFALSNEKISIRTVESNFIKEAETAMNKVSKEKLIETYVNRLLFDIILGRNIIKGIPADIDFIIKKKSGNLFVELKEKDLARSTVGFGLDKHRLEDMLEIQSKTSIPYYLVVRQVNNQIERKFLKYWIISLEKFNANMNKRLIQGGYGMRSSNSDNPTFICPINHFTELK